MKPFALAIAVTAFLAIAPAAFAHHSFAMFDRSRPITLEGVVKDFEWTSPHCWINLAVPDGATGTKLWSVEFGAPGMMARSGWAHDSLKPGDRATLVIFPLKNGGPSGSLVKVTLADGRVLVGGGPPPRPPPAS